MTVPDIEPTVLYTLTGIPDYSFGFRVFEDTDIVVIYIDSLGVVTTWVLNTDYTVTISAGGTGYITVADLGATGEIRISRLLPRTQEVAWVNNDPLDMVVQENSFDKLTMLVQEVEAVSIGYPPGFPTTVEFPLPESEKILGWSTDASTLENYPSYGSFQTLHDDAVAAAAAAALSETAAASSESAAAVSETNAATSETNAAASESAAATSETNAAASEAAASASESAAAASASAAATSEANALASEIAADGYANDAYDSAQEAAAAAAAGVQAEADIYQDALGTTKYQFGTYDDFYNEDLVDGANTTADWNQAETRMDFTVGEVIQSEDFFSADCNLTEVTEVLVIVQYTDSATPTIEATADGTNWETITNNEVHEFTNTGTTLKLRFTAGGTGYLHSWGVIYDPVYEASSPIYDTTFQKDNLLLNSAFNINERQAVSGATLTSVDDYFLDCWSASVANSAPTWADGVLTIPVGDGVKQIVEDKNIPDGTYTIAWEGTSQVSVDGGSSQTSPYTFTVSSGTHVEFDFTPGTLSKPMLVEGSVEIPWSRSRYSREALECKRYCHLLIADTDRLPFAAGRIINASSAIYFYKFPVDMYTTPTITFSTITCFDCGDGGASSQSTNVSKIDATRQGTDIVAYSSFTNVAGGSNLRLRDDQYILFEAKLT